MPSEEKLQQLWNLSDTVLYDEAVTFIQWLVNEKGCSTLPASQVTGLLNIANAASYAELTRFIRHQQERNWPESKKDIKIFYTELEKWFATVKNRRLRDEFHLIQEGRSARETNQEIDELMLFLAHEFVQHLLAENGLLAVKRASSRLRTQKR